MYVIDCKLGYDGETKEDFLWKKKKLNDILDFRFK